MKKQLLLEAKELPTRVNSLISKLSKDEISIKKFIEDPTGESVKELIPEISKKTSARDLSDGNKLIYSALANKDFRNWMDKYQDGAEKELKSKINANKSFDEIFSRERVLKDFSEAIFEHGDKKLLSTFVKLVDKDSHPVGAFAIAIVVVVAVAICVAAVIGTVGPDPVFQSARGSRIKADPQKLRSLSETMIKKAIEENTSRKRR